MSMDSPTFLILSAPANPTKSDTVAKLKVKLNKSSENAEVCPFNLPEFKVGTLDSLVSLSDDLGKMESNAESIALKLSDNLKGLLNQDMEQWKQNLSVNEKTIDQYIKTFQWNSMKYRIDKSLRELADSITQEITSIDTLMKTKMTSYAQVKSQLQGLQRKQVGNLTVRNLADILKKEQFVLDSEYLVTVPVAVPKSSEKEWYNSYETLTQMVVPRSSEKVAEDEEFSLFTVTIFQRVLEEFTHRCREFRFTVREFKWDEAQLVKDKKELADIGANEKLLWTTLLRLGKTNFGEAYACMMHIKALRIYVESILRYGLPPDFQPIVLKIKPKQDRKVRDMINQHYGNLGGKANEGNSRDDVALDEHIQHLLGDKDYSPVVLFTINVIL